MTMAARHSAARHHPWRCRIGPLIQELRAHPPPVGLCFGAYGEGSQGVHNLIERIAQKLAEERGEELGCDMDKVKGLCKQRARCQGALHVGGGGCAREGGG